MRLFLLCLLSFSVFAAEPQTLDDAGVHGLRKLEQTVSKELINPQLLAYMKSLHLAPVVVPPKPVQNMNAKDKKKEEDRYEKAWSHREACLSVNSQLRADEDFYNPVHGFTQEFISKHEDAILLTLARNHPFMRDLEEARGTKLPPFVYKP